MLLQMPQQSLIIQTRAGNAIANEASPKMMPQEIEQQMRFQQGKFPEGNQLFKRKNATGFYNCHALTFLSRRAWMGEEKAVALVLKDDNYFNVSPSDVLPGDVILYHYDNGEVEHSGVVVSSPKAENEIVPMPWILSKWGHGGEFIHRYNYCPYTWRNVRYMREGQHD